jgi:hypothetical protein
VDSTLVNRAISGIQSEGYSVQFDNPRSHLPLNHPGVSDSGRIMGLTDHQTRQVFIQTGLDPTLTLATLLHEWSHVIIQGPQVHAWLNGTAPWPRDRQIASQLGQDETEARAVAVNVLEELGVHCDLALRDLGRQLDHVGMKVLVESWANIHKATRTILAALREMEAVAA